MKNLTFSKVSMSLTALALLAVFSLAGCGGGGNNDFPVDEAVATALISKGVPSDVAQFFAAAKLESNCSTDTTCTYLQTYPNGATREITLTGANVQYTPTADEIANITPGSSPIYDVKFASSGMEDSTAQIDQSYFVPTTSIPMSPAKTAQASSLTTGGTQRVALIQLAAGAGATDGIAINWTESGKKSADVSIGSILEYFKNTGKTAPALASIYALASAASDVSGSLELSKETSAWLAELDALEQCAANPTNPVVKNDANYSATTVAIVQSARIEVKANGAMRYLNIMDETAMGLHPVLAVLSIPLKQVHLWNDETAKKVSEEDMRAARLAVVSCKDKTAPTVPANLAVTAVSESQIDLVWSASTDLYGVTGYKIYRFGTYLKSVTGTSSSDTGLAESTQYCYEVSAYDAAGNESAKSSSISGFQQCATTLPGTRPTVISTSPAAGATDAGIIPTIMVTFSRAMDPATITTAALTVSGKTVLFAYYHAATNTAEFTLSSSLARSTDYTAAINTGVKDTKGKALASDYTWSFRTAAASPAITTFSFINPAATGTISETAKTISVTVPAGTNVTALVASFTTTGTSVKVGATVQTSGVTANNFTSPVAYTVTAQDGSTAIYTVTVNFATDKWTKTFGGTGNDAGFSVQQTSDGGYIIGGYTTSYGAGGEDVYLVKTDASGNLLWTKTFGGTGNDRGLSVQQTSDGGYIVSGFTRSFGIATYAAYLIKTDSAGNALWEKNFGGSSYEKGYSVRQTSDGGYIVAGNSGISATLIRTDSSGNAVWTYPYSYYMSTIYYSVQLTSDGGYIMAGESDPMTGTDYVYLVKADSAGKLVWKRMFGVAGSCAMGSSVQLTSDGGYIVTGNLSSLDTLGGCTSPATDSYDVYLVKADASGNAVWTKTFGGTGNDRGLSVQQTSDGGYIITGYLTSSTGISDAYLIKTDSSGSALWTKPLGIYYGGVGYSVQQTSDGGYIITGSGYFGGNFSDVYLIKTDANGNAQ